MTDKELLELRNQIFLQYGVPALNSTQFIKSPFPGDWYGRNNLNDFTYSHFRLNRSFLEQVETNISRGDRWIKIELNIVELCPQVTDLEQLSYCDSIGYGIPPTSLTQMRLNQDNFQGVPLFNLASSRHKLRRKLFRGGIKKSIETLQSNIEKDLRNIDSFINQWHKIYKPLKVDWNGRLFGIDKMSIDQRLESTSLKERFYSVVSKDVEEAKRILRWLELDEDAIHQKIETTINK